jgi:hypothetical protein
MDEGSMLAFFLFLAFNLRPQSYEGLVPLLFMDEGSFERARLRHNLLVKKVASYHFS